MTRKYYRMSSIGKSALPTTWAYDGVEDDAVQLAPGAQVWNDAAQIAQCALGAEMDGVYDAEHGYAHVMVIEARAVVDGGPWDAVVERDIVSIKSVETSKFVEALSIALFDLAEFERDEDESDWREDFCNQTGDWPARWIADNDMNIEDALDELLGSITEQVTVVFVDTLTHKR
jgi:hypothetical protein